MLWERRSNIKLIHWLNTQRSDDLNLTEKMNERDFWHTISWYKWLFYDYVEYTMRRLLDELRQHFLQIPNFRFAIILTCTPNEYLTIVHFGNIVRNLSDS